MSPPTREFGRLSIRQNMPDDQAQAPRSARDSDDDEDDEEEESPSARSSNEDEGGEGIEDENDSEESSNDDESTDTSTVRAQSGITYDLRHLDSVSVARALVGLNGQFGVVNCHTSDSGHDFQLLDRPRVHIGSDSPTCTCSTFQARPEAACHHIFVRVPRNFCDPYLPRSALILPRTVAP